MACKVSSVSFRPCALSCCAHREHLASRQSQQSGAESCCIGGVQDALNIIAITDKSPTDMLGAAMLRTLPACGNQRMQAASSGAFHSLSRSEAWSHLDQGSPHREFPQL